MSVATAVVARKLRIIYLLLVHYHRAPPRLERTVAGRSGAASTVSQRREPNVVPNFGSALKRLQGRPAPDFICFFNASRPKVCSGFGTTTCINPSALLACDPGRARAARAELY